MRLLLLSLLLLLTLSSCSSSKPVIVHTAPPRIDCSERMPAEVAPMPPTQADVTRLGGGWQGVALALAGSVRQWQGVATAEVVKRSETADCLDREREAGRIQ